MAYRTTHLLFSPPRIIDGVLHRGVMSTDQPTLLDDELRREWWTVLLFFHAPLVPRAEPNVDLYVTSPSFADQTPEPYVCFSDRDLVDENDYYPIDCEKEFDAMFCVNWLPFKRHELMIDALEYARDAGRPISCLWFGYHYNDQWHDREAMLREEVARRGIDVHFAETDFDVNEVIRRYNIARCAVNCSEQEGGPRTLTEATLCDVPFVVTRDTFGGCPELLGEQAGIVCDPSPRGLAEAIWHAADHGERFSPRAWAVQNLCRRVALERLRVAVTELAEQSGQAINLDDLALHGYDWEHKNGLIRATEAEFEKTLVSG